ncbi:hypothetical protein, partial [Burkholderia gladioli]|uniref:hypothetical protein n=1 Tax=Burkholderia gladioli TaxID=28095 RepID=UPI0034DB6D17
MIDLIYHRGPALARSRAEAPPVILAAFAQTARRIAARGRRGPSTGMEIDEHALAIRRPARCRGRHR